MKGLESLLAEIRKGKRPSLLLFHGDDFQVHAAVQATLDLLAPEEIRTFNLERFDGRSTPWEQIEESLMTPALFAGNKTVFVEDAPFFISREQKGDLSEKLLELWRGGRKDEAVKFFTDLLVLEGWTQERWEKLEGPLSVKELGELFGQQGREIRNEVEEIVAFCRSGGKGPGQRRTAGEHRLLELLEQGLPPWATLLLAASHVDRRIRLYRKFEEKGAVLDLSPERDRSGRISREALAEFVDRRLSEAGKKVEARAREIMLARAGEELWAVHGELEKLLLYVGDEPWIRAQDVEEVFLDQAEAWVFDLTASIIRREPARALDRLARLVTQGEHPLKLLGALASEVRRLLAARQLMEGKMLQRWQKGMTFPQFQRNVLDQGAPLLTRSPYGDYLSFQRAENFTTGELLRYLDWIRQTDMRLKSTGNQPRIVMERLVLEMCQQK